MDIGVWKADSYYIMTKYWVKLSHNNLDFVGNPTEDPMPFFILGIRTEI